MTSFKKAKSNNWIEADEEFGELSSFKENPTLSGKKGRKRPRVNNNTLRKTPVKAAAVPSLDSERFPAPEPSKPLNPSELWINNHRPASAEELAVNSKKVEEVRCWLGRARSEAGCLVLTGPPGAGKTATFLALSQELGLAVQEWLNPVEQVNFQGEKLYDEEVRDFQDTVEYVSKAKQFKQWLRGAKYSSFSGSKVILIEDLPSQRPEDLHETVETFLNCKSRVPIVFIITESATAEKSGSLRLIFPPDVLERLKIKVISFNPVTTTNMVKTMTKLAVAQCQRGVRKFQVPDKATLENLAESVGGDLRAGINALQFSCLNDTRDLRQAFEGVSKIASSKAGKSAVRKGDKKSETKLSRIGGKDQGLVMFHALGKILYAKREDQMEVVKLPEFLRGNSRKVLKCNPDEVIDKTTLSHDAFNCFLHHNYPPFFSKIEDSERASEYLSISDLFLKEWSNGGKVSLSEYGGIVGARGMMFSNTEMPPNLGMMKLTKPEHYGVTRRVKQRNYELQNVFHAQPNKDLVTSTVPLISRIRPTFLPANKLALISDVGTFPGIKQVTIKNSTPIDQNDIFNESQDTEDVEMKSKEDEVNIPQVIDDDDELIIEQFED